MSDDSDPVIWPMVTAIFFLCTGNEEEAEKIDADEGNIRFDIKLAIVQQRRGSERGRSEAEALILDAARKGLVHISGMPGGPAGPTEGRRELAPNDLLDVEFGATGNEKRLALVPLTYGIGITWHALSIRRGDARLLAFENGISASAREHNEKLSSLQTKVWLTLSEALWWLVIKSNQDGARLAQLVRNQNWNRYDALPSLVSIYGAELAPLFPKAREAWLSAVKHLRDQLRTGSIVAVDTVDTRVPAHAWEYGEASPQWWASEIGRYGVPGHWTGIRLKREDLERACTMDPLTKARTDGQSGQARRGRPPLDLTTDSTLSFVAELAQKHWNKHPRLTAQAITQWMAQHPINAKKYKFDTLETFMKGKYEPAIRAGIDPPKRPAKPQE